MITEIRKDAFLDCPDSEDPNLLSSLQEVRQIKETWSENKNSWKRLTSIHLSLVFANLDLPPVLKFATGFGFGCMPSNTGLDNKPGKFAFGSEKNRCQDILRLHQPKQNLLPAAAQCSRASSFEPHSSLAAGLIKIAFLYLKWEMKSRTCFRRVEALCLLFCKIPVGRCTVLRNLHRVRVTHMSIDCAPALPNKEGRWAALKNCMKIQCRFLPC